MVVMGVGVGNSQRRERKRERAEKVEMMGGNSGGCRGDSHRPG